MHRARNCAARIQVPLAETTGAESVLYGGRTGVLHRGQWRHVRFFRQRFGFALKRHFEYLIDPFNRMNLEPVFNVVRYFREILNVVLWN